MNRSILPIVMILLSACNHLPYEIDPVATARMPWKPGETARSTRGMLSDPSYESYRKFLGVSTKGEFWVQDFYLDSDKKLTDPFAIQSYDSITYPGGYDPNISLTTLIVWGKNGNKQIERQMKNGKRHGATTLWYENGQKKEESIYVNGKLDGWSTKWCENGNKYSEVEFKDNHLNGEWRLFECRDTVIQTGQFKNNQRDGTWIDWSPEGKKEGETHYEYNPEIKPYQYY